MPQKSYADMNPFERLHYSLKAKTCRAIVLFSLIISLAAISFGFYLYASAVNREYRSRTWQMSKTAVQLLDTKEVLLEAEQVIQTYQAMTEAEKLQLQDKASPLLERFEGVRGPGFDQICTVLRRIQQSNGGIAAFTAFLDPSANRRVFITDSDLRDSFCPPGSLDMMDPEVIDDLLNGSASFLDRLYGVGSMNATTINMVPYGYRCMAGTFIAQVNGYPVYVFFDTDLNQAARTSRHFLWQYVGLMTSITLLVLAFAIRYMNRTTIDPINRLAGAAQAYILDDAKDQQTKKHFANLPIATGDEIEKLYLTMAQMESDLGSYMQNLTRITAEKERINTELSLATRIQLAMLPHIFPPFPDRTEFDIYASMDPAKAVGGDFYDFFLVDEDHLCMVMADVSGKGVPAALFMMASKIILQSVAMLGASPAQILNKTNEAVCSNNQEEMFITVWLGILEISTGKLLCANAGHEYPVLKNGADDAFALFKDRHGLVIGAMEGVRYQEYELQLTPGARLFVYTDGVPEATDRENRLFGSDRMLAAMNRAPEGSPQEILERVREAVDMFVQDAEQFDDMTMLCLQYNGPAQQPADGTGSPDTQAQRH